MEPVIAVDDLSMRYGELDAVAGATFDVRRGEVFALLGPNGAGKTTTVEILEGHRRRSGGYVRVLGVDPERGGRRFRQRIGIVLQDAGLDGELTVAESLALFASFYPQPLDLDEVVDLVNLDVRRRARVRTLSGGQRRRLDLALGLVGDPELLFLDEPTTGFDPEARRQAWSVLSGLRQLGKTILLTSHYMDEVQHLADRVAVLVAGRIVSLGTPGSLGGRDVGLAEIRFRLPRGTAGAGLPTGLAETIERDGDELLLRTERPTALLADLARWAEGIGGELPGLTVTRPSLEDAYLTLLAASGPEGHGESQRGGRPEDQAGGREGHAGDFEGPAERERHAGAYGRGEPPGDVGASGERR